MGKKIVAEEDGSLVFIIVLSVGLLLGILSGFASGNVILGSCVFGVFLGISVVIYMISVLKSLFRCQMLLIQLIQEIRQVGKEGE